MNPRSDILTEKVGRKDCRSWGGFPLSGWERMFQCAQQVVTQHDTEGGREEGREEGKKGGNGCHEMCPGEGGSDGSHSGFLLGEGVGVNGLLVTGMEGDHGAENKASLVSYPAGSTSEIKKSRNLMRGRRGTVPTFPKHYHDRRWAAICKRWHRNPPSPFLPAS